MVTLLNWNFIIPKKVCDELQKKSISNQLGGLIDNNIIEVESCSNGLLLQLQKQLIGIDDGELEAICIVDKCEDRKFTQYLILIDDVPAQKKAGELGMKSLDIVMFLFMANQKGFLESKQVRDSITILESAGYFITPPVKKDISKRLIN
ncbi:MAG: hypothetical protein GWN01_16190 [Nitrosopumilaceae archaeon]|nr:hypothetical protein [Nitrosopumilaceae archaeon]NIV66958.1 hypothetical protein [Nitrosopumilaceae archaeon]NIX62978.1 hypothetical protein [Nitrosopumilaceae archaeon]